MNYDTYPSRYTSRIESIDAQVSMLLAARAAAEQAERKIGFDIYEDGNILTWEKCFEGGSTCYSYAALKAGGRWYMTGAKAPSYGLTWVQLTDEIVRGCGGDYPDIYVVETLSLVGEQD